MKYNTYIKLTGITWQQYVLSKYKPPTSGCVLVAADAAGYIAAVNLPDGSTKRIGFSRTYDGAVSMYKEYKHDI